MAVITFQVVGKSLEAGRTFGGIKIVREAAVSSGKRNDYPVECRNIQSTIPDSMFATSKELSLGGWRTTCVVYWRWVLYVTGCTKQNLFI